MAFRHRKRAQTANRIATVGAATATVTAVMVGAVPPPTANAAATTATPELPSMPLAPSTDNAVSAATEAAVPAAQPKAPAPNGAKVLADNNVTDTPTVVTDVSGKPDDAIKAATARTQASAKKAQARLDASAKKAGDRLDKIAKDGQKQIQKAAKHVADDLQKTVKAVTGAGKSAEKKASAKSGD